MNRLCKIVLAAAVAAASLACGTASAHPHTRFGVDFVIGPGPWWWGPPYYPYYYPPVVVADPVYAPPAPVVQVPAPPTYWYYCRQANAYYPYVSECPSGWEQVAPQPPAPSAPAPSQR
jgi:hypothetical protein